MRKLRNRLPSHGTAVAYLALFAALATGGAYAANNLVGSRDIAKNAVKSKHIAKKQVKSSDLARNAVKSSKVADGTLLRKDFAAGQLPPGATNLWAVVDSAGTILRGSGAVSAATVGSGYEVIFSQDVSACSYSATLGATAAEVGEAGVGPRNGKPNGVFVFTADSTGTEVARGFNLQVFC